MSDDRRWFLIESTENQQSLAIRCKKCQQLLRCRANGWVRCKCSGLMYVAPTNLIGLPVIPSRKNV
jgi:hypothetical protein